jgi:hypothetical protein
MVVLPQLRVGAAQPGRPANEQSEGAHGGDAPGLRDALLVLGSWYHETH